MAKAKKKTVVVKCACSTCGQVASVTPGKEHAFCRGFKIVKPLPAMFAELKNPKRMGTWVPIPEINTSQVDAAKALDAMAEKLAEA